MVFNDRSDKEEMVKTISLREKTRGETYFKASLLTVREKNVSIPMPVSIDTENPSSVTIENFNVGIGR